MPASLLDDQLAFHTHGTMVADRAIVRERAFLVRDKLDRFGLAGLDLFCFRADKFINDEIMESVVIDKRYPYRLALFDPYRAG